jgi:hypothetical protein
MGEFLGKQRIPRELFSKLDQELWRSGGVIVADVTAKQLLLVLSLSDRTNLEIKTMIH